MDTPETPRCTARSSRTGERCRKRPMVGSTVCYTHGGMAPQVRNAAERRRAEAEAEQVVRRLLWNPDAAPVTDSVGEMQRLAGSMRHAVDVLGANLDDPDDLDEVKATAWLRVLRELRTLLADMKRLGIAEYAVNVEAAKVKLMAVAFGRALDVLDPSPEDRQAATRVLLAELRSAAEVQGGEVA